VEDFQLIHRETGNVFVQQNEEANWWIKRLHKKSNLTSIGDLPFLGYFFNVVDLQYSENSIISSASIV